MKKYVDFTNLSEEETLEVLVAWVRKKESYHEGFLVSGMTHNEGIGDPEVIYYIGAPSASYIIWMGNNGPVVKRTTIFSVKIEVAP